METLDLNTVSNTQLFRLFVEEKNKEAISLFFQNQTDLFYRVALKYTKNSADAEDVLQASFIKIIDKADQYKGLHTDQERLLQSWCLSIIVNCALKRTKSESIRKKNELNYSTQNTQLLDEEENMDTSAEKEKVHKKVQEAIIQLPEKYRIPIHLKYVEGFELEAIADILKLNGNTLRSIIKRGLEKLSDQLKAEKVTLSSVGLIGMIEALPVEHAPVAVKSMASKIMTTANSSRRLMTKSSAKFSWLSAKGISILAVSSLAILGGIFSVNKFNVASTKSTNANPIAAIQKVEKKDTNGTWLMGKQYVETVSVIMGNIAYSEKVKLIYAEPNRPIFLSMPISVQSKPFLLECIVAPQISNDNPAAKLLFQGYWVKDNIMIKHDGWENKDRYTLTTTNTQIEKVYYYNNYVCTFVNDKCYHIRKYPGDLKDARAAVLSRNFMYQKISSRTLDAPPEELLQAIKSVEGKQSKVQFDWVINEKHLNIDN